jgi:hypothetical protein
VACFTSTSDTCLICHQCPGHILHVISIYSACLIYGKDRTGLECAMLMPKDERRRQPQARPGPGQVRRHSTLASLTAKKSCGPGTKNIFLVLTRKVFSYCDKTSNFTCPVQKEKIWRSSCVKCTQLSRSRAVRYSKRGKGRGRAHPVHR